MIRAIKIALVVASGTVTLGATAFSYLAYGVYSADSAWRALHRAACRGDVEYFDAHIDRTRISKDALSHVDVGNSELLSAVAESTVRGRLDQLEDEVKRGAGGAVCGWVWVDTAGDYVRFDAPNGDELFAQFENDDGHWLLISIGKR